MTDQLEFPELKRAYLQSLPTEQAILARMRTRRPAVPNASSRWGLYAFGFAGAIGLAALVVVLAPNGGEPQAQLSAEPLQPTAIGAMADSTSAAASDLVARPRDVVNEDEGPNNAAKFEPAVIDQSTAPKSNRRKPSSSTKLTPPPTSGAKATWSEVGILLRNGQEAEAQRKIAELAQSEDVETREGALLFQLRQKVQLARKARTSVEPEVRVELRKLAEGGSTSSVRLTAKRLLGELD